MQHSAAIGPKWARPKENNNANQVTLVAAEAHVRIIRAMDRHQYNAKVQETACSALLSLATNDANKVTFMAAEAHVRIMRRGKNQRSKNSRGNSRGARPTADSHDSLTSAVF
jgi:hypothetical protein